MNTIALKVISFNSIAKVISIIRNYNPISMGEIRTAIENGSYVLEYDFFSHWGVRELRRCYDELTKAGITCEIYDNRDRMINRDDLCNIIRSYRITEKEVRAEMEAESSDEDE